jgi:hypothetical protein
MDEYSKHLLPELAQHPRNTLGKRLIEMVREYVATDPRYQTKLDVFE